jgi:prepilin peptidase CpaA
MVLLFIIVFCAIVALGFGAAAAWSDFTRLTIPNIYVLSIAIAFVPAFIASKIFAADTSFFGTWSSHLLAGAGVFAVTYLLFYFKVIGGGDAKLLTVYGLWTGLSGLTPLFFYMAVVGGILGLSTLALIKWKPVAAPVKGSWIEKAQTGAQEVPYGIAIFTGAVIAFYKIGYFQPAQLMALAGANGGV